MGKSSTLQAVRIALQPSPVVCFLDESATDAKDSDQAVLGGIVINRKDIPEFNTAWTEMLRRHGIESGLHMIELGSKGPHPHLIGEACSALLTDAVGVINRCRIFTFGATANNREHEILFSRNMRLRHFSVYGLAFMMAVEINRASAEREGYSALIDYVLDEGNRFKRHVVQMHNAIHTQSELSSFKVGRLDFSTDAATPALQAADVIAWSTRRLRVGKPLQSVYLR